MATKRIEANPQLAALVGTEFILATAVAGGTDTGSNPVAEGADIKIPVHQLLGMKVHAVVVAGSVATVDCGHGLVRNHTLLLTENVTLALSNIAPAGYVTEGEIRIVQDATGGRVLTLPPAFKPLGGSDIAVKSAASGVTILAYKTMNDGATVEYAMQESA